MNEDTYPAIALLQLERRLQSSSSNREVAFRAVNDATFSVSCNTNGGTIDYTNTVPFYAGTLNTSVPANGRLKQVNAEVARDQAQFNVARRDVAATAAAAYMDGNLTSMAALITSASPQTVLSRAAMLVQLSATRSAQMHQFITAARQLSGAQQAAKRRQQESDRIAHLNKSPRPPRREAFRRNKR